MYFDKIIHGTQYYRTPTPLPNEWESDISQFEEYGIDAFQIRINWRWNERREGEYDFSDVDMLMKLAERNNRQVVIKFLLECAPQYIFDKYDGTRIGPRGEQLRGGSHGAFFGGWRPCFENPMVKERAALFVAEVAKRYAGHPNLILWNAWNEIRNKPMEDCFCPHCRRGFGKYLEKKFGTVEALNDFYGTAEDSFDTIALPSTPQGYWDTFEFKKYKGGVNLYEFLKNVYDAIRLYDKETPIMAHVGICSAFQTTLADVCDDYTAKRAVDFWGTSIPCDTEMKSESQRLDFMMLGDYLRAIDESYFMHEIYPGLGMFKYSYDDIFDMKFKLYTALSSGAKGLIYWQYRAERVGHEADCAGLVRADGTPREVTEAVKAFAEAIKPISAILTGARVKKGDVAIVSSFDSQLISEIDDACGPDFHFDKGTEMRYYRKSHAGMYRLLRRENFNVDYVDTTEWQKFSNYKVLYFPYHAILSDECSGALEEFIREGGTVIADEGFALRDTNTWMKPYDIECKQLLVGRLRERRRTSGEELTICGTRVKFLPYKSEYLVPNGKALLYFDNGKPAVQSLEYGKGKIILSGVPLGYSSYDSQNPEIAKFVGMLCDEAGASRYKLGSFKDGVYEKRLEIDGGELVFMFNCSEEKKVFEIDAHEFGIDFKSVDGGLSLDRGEIGYFII